MVAVTRRPLAEIMRATTGRRRPAPMAVAAPRSHVGVLTADAPPAPAVSTHERAVTEARSPIVRPPCVLLGGHFPTTPPGAYFYGCEVRP